MNLRTSLAAIGLMAVAAIAEAAPPLTTFQSIIWTNLWIQVNTTIPNGTTPYCDIVVSVTDIDSQAAYTNNYSETISVPATASGNAYFCTPSIPYSWALSAQGNATINITYSAGFASNGGTPVSSRTTSSSLGTFTVPNNGVDLVIPQRVVRL
jgi:hypothetical protein